MGVIGEAVAPRVGLSQAERRPGDDAVLQGLDGSFTIPLVAGLALEGQVSLLRGYRMVPDSGEDTRHRDWLPLMPADRFQYGLGWSNDRQTFVRLMATTALEQIRIPEQGLLKAPPGRYTVLSLDAGHTFRIGRTKPLEGKTPDERAIQSNTGQMLEVGLSIRNLGNTTYREYLNFFRFFTDEPGINIGLRAKWHFG